ncbi:MAG: hypothetical protein HY254_12180 [Burkholderiales bacterium]|nr:hypothetical protein [Burkholderiales bacterium]
MLINKLLYLMLGLVLLTACERLGVPDPAKEAALKEADAKATGSACRHAGRAIEDCYSLNPDAARAPVYAGWKEMNDYMRENSMTEVKPVVEASASASASASEEASASASASASGHASAKASASH